MTFAQQYQTDLERQDAYLSSSLTERNVLKDK